MLHTVSAQIVHLCITPTILPLRGLSSSCSCYCEHTHKSSSCLHASDCMGTLLRGAVSVTAVQEAMGRARPGPCTLAFFCWLLTPTEDAEALLLLLLLVALSMVIFVGVVVVVVVMIGVVVLMMLKEANLPPSRLVCAATTLHRLGGGHILSSMHTCRYTTNTQHQRHQHDDHNKPQHSQHSKEGAVLSARGNTQSCKRCSD